MKHFGYGSNMSLEYLRTFCPSARFLSKAYLPNYEVQFRFFSPKRQGGVSTIVEAPGKLVHGVMYDIAEKEIQELDATENLHRGFYKRETFLVLADDGKWHEADLYRVTEPKGPFAPDRGYVELMLSGAKEHGLDPDYIKKIESYLAENT